MPSNISDSNSVSYDYDSMNAIAATAVGLTEEMMTGVTFDKDFVTSITNTADSVTGLLVILSEKSDFKRLCYKSTCCTGS